MIEVFEELEKLFTKKFLERIPRVPDKSKFEELIFLLFELGEVDGGELFGIELALCALEVLDIIAEHKNELVVGSPALCLADVD